MADSEYDQWTGEDLLHEAQDRDISGRSNMNRDELQAALEADDAGTPDDGGDVEPYVNPGSPTSGVPTPAEQPGRLGSVEAAPPDFPVPVIQHAWANEK